MPFLRNTSSKCISDTTFDSAGNRIVVVSDQGHWIVFELKVQKKESVMVSSGSLELSLLGSQPGGLWWKAEWKSVDNTVVIAESRGLHVLDIAVLESPAEIKF